MKKKNFKLYMEGGNYPLPFAHLHTAKTAAVEMWEHESGTRRVYIEDLQGNVVFEIKTQDELEYESELNQDEI